MSQLVEVGILEPIQFTDWVASIVPILKSDKSKHSCGDFKCTVNQECKLDCYPIPKVVDLFAQLADGKLFTKLDFRKYQYTPWLVSLQQVALWPVFSSRYIPEGDGKPTSR